MTPLQISSLTALAPAAVRSISEVASLGVETAASSFARLLSPAADADVDADAVNKPAATTSENLPATDQDSFGQWYDRLVAKLKNLLGERLQGQEVEFQIQPGGRIEVDPNTPHAESITAVLAEDFDLSHLADQLSEAKAKAQWQSASSSAGSLSSPASGTVQVRIKF